jgi:hypothetical protein
LGHILDIIQYGDLNSPEYTETYYQAEKLYELYTKQKEVIDA